MTGQAKAYTTVVTTDQRHRVLVPFDPDQAWGTKPSTACTAPLTAWACAPPWNPSVTATASCSAPPGDATAASPPATPVNVVLAPEGPQRDDLAPDIAAALAADPDAGAFFDSLAQFYRRAYLRWIDSTKRRPELRAHRIAAMIELLKSRGTRHAHVPNAHRRRSGIVNQTGSTQPATLLRAAVEDTPHPADVR